jgi:outer membrane protein
MRAIVCLAAAAAVAVPGLAGAQPAAPPTGEQLTLTGAVELALRVSPDLAISQENVESARYRLKSSRGRRLPAVSVASTLLYWDQALEFAVAPGMALTVRDRVTTSSSATAALPLSQQVQIGNLVAVERHGLEASEEDHSARRLDVASNVASAYLGVLLARATSDIAQARTQLVQAQLERSRVLKEGGVLGQVDVMRLEAALAATRRNAISAAADAESAVDALVLAIGLPESTEVQLVDELPEQVSVPPMSPDEAVRQAMQRRPELRAARSRAEQARSGASVEKANLLPSLSAFGTVEHNTGNGPFLPKNAWYLGLQLNWNVWDWGTTYYGYKAASHRADQAERSAARLADALRVEVRRTARDARAAYDALEVARTGQAAAEEAFRIQVARFHEGATTTTELLQAETEVAEARIGYATARHAYFLALASLARAVGQLPDALLPISGKR